MNWDLKTGQRVRAWDGCLLDGFTKVAPAHEFRKARADRFRHRLYRKAAYVPQKIGGQIACVGCGRCVGGVPARHREPRERLQPSDRRPGDWLEGFVI